MRMRSIAACTLRLPPRFRRVTAAHVGTTSPPCRQRSMLCSKEKLPTGHLRLPKPWPEQALNRHRVRWKPLRKGWAKYRLRRSMLLGKPWRVRVQPMTLATRQHASNFFDLGGHSLLAGRVLARVANIFGVSFPIRTLFEGPTIDALARRVEEAREMQSKEPRSEIAFVEAHGPQSLSIVQENVFRIERELPGLPQF